MSRLKKTKLREEIFFLVLALIIIFGFSFISNVSSNNLNLLTGAVIGAVPVTEDVQLGINGSGIKEEVEDYEEENEFSNEIADGVNVTEEEYFTNISLKEEFIDNKLINESVEKGVTDELVISKKDINSQKNSNDFGTQDLSIQASYCSGDYNGIGNWEINTSLTCNNEEIYLNGNLTVQDAGDLTFNNITLIVNATSDNEFRIKSVEGSNFTIQSASNITSVNPSYYYEWNNTGTLYLYDSYVSYIWGNLNPPYTPAALAISGSNSKVYRSTIENCKTIGIVVSDGASNVTIENNTVRNNGNIAALSFGIIVTNGANATIKGNNVTDHNIAFGYNFGIYVNVATATIENNLVENTGLGGAAGTIPIFVDNANGSVTVRNNVVSGSTLAANGGVIQLSNTRDVGIHTVEGNNVTNQTTADYGISFSNSTDVNVLNNLVSNVDKSCIFEYISYNINFTGNTVSNCGNSGGGIYASTSDLTYVYSNSIANTTGHGLFLNGANNVYAYHNTVTNSSAGDGISIYNSINITTVNNTINSASQSGIYARTGSKNIQINDSTIIDSAGNGIWIAATNETYIYSNNVTGSNLSGVFVDESNNTDVYHNTITSSTAYGLLIDKVKNYTAFNNTIYHSNQSGIVIQSNSQDIYINQSTIYNTTQQGIAIFASSLVYLYSNSINTTTFSGIFTDNCSNSEFSHNSIFNTTLNGINLASSNNLTILNHSISYARDKSLYIINSQKIEMNDSTFFNSTEGIMNIDNSTLIIFNNLVLNFSNNSAGIFVSNNASVNLTDSVILGVGNPSSFDMDVKTNSTLYLINTTFNRSNVLVQNEGSFLSVQWYLDTTIQNSTGSGLNASNVTIYNVSGVSLYSALTNTSGQIARQTLIEFTQNSTAKTYHTPHSVNVTLTEYLSNSTTVNLTATNSTVTTLSLQVSFTPNTTQVILNATSDNNYTDDTLTCYANITDDNGGNVYANYTWYKNGVVNSTGQSAVFTEGTLANIANITSGDTSMEDNWTCSVQAYDGTVYEGDWNNATIKVRTGCGTITTSLTLNENLAQTGNCFTIGANNIVLNGAGYTITSNGSGTGINGGGYDNITIKNFAGINNFSTAINIGGMDDSVIYNNTIEAMNDSSKNGIDTVWVVTNNINITENTITVPGNDSYPIYLIHTFNSTIHNNTLKTTGDIGAYGIYSFNGSYNNITFNTFNITGEQEGRGIYFNSESSFNLFENNVIYTGEMDVTSGLGHTAIRVESSSIMNEINNNTITNEGNSSTGINLGSTISGILSNNTITTNGTGSSGMNIQGTSVNISSNTLISYGNTSPAIEVSGTYINLSYNTATTYGNGTSAVIVESDYNTIYGNNFTSVASSNPLFISAGQYITIQSNRLNLSYAGTSTPLVMSATNHTIVKNNTLFNFVSTQRGISMYGGADNITLHNNTYPDVTQFDVIIETFGDPVRFKNILFLDEHTRDYFFQKAELIFRDSNEGELKFLNQTITASGINLSAEIIVKPNNIYVDTATQALFNEPANLTIYNTDNLNLTKKTILRNGDICPSTICTELISADTYLFNVTQFSNYSIAEDPVIPNITNLLPATNLAFNISNVIEIAANVTDNNNFIDTVLANVTYPNGTVTELTLTNGTSYANKYNYSFTAPDLSGDYNITFYANDTSANSNETESTNFTVNDVVIPNVTGLIPTASTIYNTSDIIEIAANVSDDLNVSVVLVNIKYPNGTINQSALTLAVGNKYNYSFTIPTVNGTYNLTFIANDSSNNINNSETTNFTVIILDTDGDGVEDSSDTLLGNITSIESTGITALNITINGNATNGTFSGDQEVLFYDAAKLLINFTHNFSASNIDLRNVNVIVSSTSIIVNLSGQLTNNETKTLYLTDNNFASLCVKDAEISSVDEISAACDGTNETNFNTCLGVSTGTMIGNITCYDEGTIIRIENLSYSGVRGTVASAAASSSSSSSGGGSTSGWGICGDGVCNDGEKCALKNTINNNYGECYKDCGLCKEEENVDVDGGVGEEVIESTEIASEEEIISAEEDIEDESKKAALVGKALFIKVKSIFTDYSTLWLVLVVSIIIISLFVYLLTSKKLNLISMKRRVFAPHIITAHKRALVELVICILILLILYSLISRFWGEIINFITNLLTSLGMWLVPIVIFIISVIVLLYLVKKKRLKKSNK